MTSSIAALLLSLTTLLSGLTTTLDTLIGSPSSQVAQVVNTQNLPLVQKSDISYVGSFDVPDDGQFGYMTHTGITFNPIRKSLYIGAWSWAVSDYASAEITIPALGGRATFLQPVSPSFEGKLSLIGDDGQGQRPGGHYVYKGKLYMTAFLYYRAGTPSLAQLFSRPLDLSVRGQVTNPAVISSTLPDFTNGYMADVPAEWQSALGSPSVTGNCCLSIKSRTSYGPALFTLDPENPGVSKPLVYYDSNHQNLGLYDCPGCVNPKFNGTTRVTGVLIPPGTATVLFIGSTGLGPWIYANATDNAPPEVGYVWAYNINDLIAVKNGQKNPWDVYPYWHGDLVGFGNTQHDFGTGGVAFDPSTKTFYVAKPSASTQPDTTRPKIFVYKLNVGTATTPTPTTTPVPTPNPFPIQDTTLPTATIVSPTGTTVSGGVTVSANAGDNVAVAGVQFKLDGVNLGSEDTSSPYSISWDTTTATNGTHTLTATARDTSGNTGVSFTVTVTVSNTVSPPTTPSLVGQWNFDENSGSTASDSTGNGNTGTISGATWTAGKSGGALSFDGVDDFVNVGSGSKLTNLGTITVSAWVKPNDMSVARTILTKNDGSEYLLRIQGSNALRFYTTTSGLVSNQTVANFTPGTWYHVVGVYNGSQMTNYINGVAVGSTSQTGAIKSSTNPLYIGRYQSGGLPFSGSIDDVRVYNYALSPTEVLNLYNSVPAVQTPTPTPTDATVSSWSSWSDTSTWSTCLNGTQTKTQQRTRTVITQATNGGTTPTLTETQTVSQSCTTETTQTPEPTPTTSTKFVTGDSVQTTSSLNVRATASSDGSLLGTQTFGSTGKVSDGPLNSRGINWWKVDYVSSPDGWSSEDYLAKYTQTSLPQPTPTPEPAPTPVPTTTEPTPTTETPSETASKQLLTKNLRLGSRDYEVTILQKYLISKGYLATGLNTGYFGYSTYNAVKAFQRANGISTTGSVGPQTRAVINAGL